MYGTLAIGAKKGTIAAIENLTRRNCMKNGRQAVLTMWDRILTNGERQTVQVWKDAQTGRGFLSCVSNDLFSLERQMNPRELCSHHDLTKDLFTTSYTERLRGVIPDGTYKDHLLEERTVNIIPNFRKWIKGFNPKAAENKRFPSGYHHTEYSVGTQVQSKVAYVDKNTGNIVGYDHNYQYTPYISPNPGLQNASLGGGQVIENHQGFFWGEKNPIRLNGSKTKNSIGQLWHIQGNETVQDLNKMGFNIVPHDRV